MRMKMKCLPQVPRQPRGTLCPCCRSGEAGQPALWPVFVIHFAKQCSELNNFYSVPNVCGGVINFEVMRWVGHIARIGDMCCA
jgi:hypothetical protein